MEGIEVTTLSVGAALTVAICSRTHGFVACLTQYCTCQHIMQLLHAPDMHAREVP